MSGPRNQVINPITGRAVDATDEQASALAAIGGRAVSAEEAASLQKGAANLDYVDQNFSAPEKFAAGVGSGLTLGLGPAALAYMGLADPGHISALEQSGAYTAGDLAGMVLPAALSGGEGLVARGLSRATPAGLMGMAGSGAERLAAGLLPEMGVMGKLARPALTMGARGAAEGAIVNAAHTASDAVIQNHPLTWSAIAASTADGALMGGLLGGAFGGVTGLASGVVDAVGPRAADAIGGAVGKGESRGAAIALKRVGAGASDFERMAAREGGVLEDAKALHEILKGEGASYASDTSTISRAVKGSVQKNVALAEETIQNLEKDAAHMAPSNARVAERLKAEIGSKYAGTILQNDAERIVAKIAEDINPAINLKAPVAPEPFVPSVAKSGLDEATISKNVAGASAYKRAVSDYEKAVAEFETSSKTGSNWKQWHDTRQAVSELAKGTGLKSEVYKSVLDVVDSEMRAAMDSAGASAGKEFTKVYTGALAGKAMAEQFTEMTSKRLGEELTKSRPTFDKPDAGTIAWGTLMGHPLGAAAIVAGKKSFDMIGRRMEPYLAEAAYRSSVGAKAEASRIAVSNRMTNGVRKFIGLAPKGATFGLLEAKRAPKPQYSTKAFQAQLEATENLLSVQHRQRVMEMAATLREIGQPLMADAALKQYDAAVAYLRYNMPQNPKIRAMGSAGKLPIESSLDSKSMKFMLMDNAIRNPLSLIDRLEDGTINPIEVKAVKYVYPEFHAQLVDTARTELMEMKMEGKFLPTDKVALLGTALDEPIDSTLTKEFVDTIQAAHAVNHQPPPEPGPKPPVTDVTDFQTPTQRALG